MHMYMRTCAHVHAHMHMHTRTHTRARGARARTYAYVYVRACACESDRLCDGIVSATPECIFAASAPCSAAQTAKGGGLRCCPLCKVPVLTLREIKPNFQLRAISAAFLSTVRSGTEAAGNTQHGDASDGQSNGAARPDGEQPRDNGNAKGYSGNIGDDVEGCGDGDGSDEADGVGKAGGDAAEDAGGATEAEQQVRRLGRCWGRRWTVDEEEVLSRFVAERGTGAWQDLAVRLSGRTASAIEQHWMVMQGLHPACNQGGRGSASLSAATARSAAMQGHPPRHARDTFQPDAAEAVDGGDEEEAMAMDSSVAVDEEVKAGGDGDRRDDHVSDGDIDAEGVPRRKPYSLRVRLSSRGRYRDDHGDGDITNADGEPGPAMAMLTRGRVRDSDGHTNADAATAEQRQYSLRLRTGALPKQTVRYDANLVGARVKILWDRSDGYAGDWYAGTIVQYAPANEKHLVVYDDNDSQWHELFEDECNGQLQWL